ncbi:hypothetical protein D9611_012309 [Ephemerocybe angulata]|uniref:DUF6534 domain-containing protein n=1 Tax=Ephemerocybe angulata TaxID=980116 RepID=A0A8H5AUQ8_9AGAR|nr:hypothetical protein D9611_012309 [Tulosesus angulatus]
MAPMLTSLADTSLNNTIGAAYLGVVGAGFLFGVTTLQMYSYYHSYPKDPIFQKASVAVLWVLDAFHLALVVHAVYQYAITGFGDVAGLLVIQWSVQLQVTINVIVILMVHCLYTMRVWKLSGYHRGVLGYISVSVVAAGFAIGLFLSFKVFKAKFFSDLDDMAWVIAAALGTSTAIDFFIAAAMSWYLHKSRGVGSRLNSRIDLVMQYSLGSGLLTSACSLSAMFTYLLLPNTFVFLGLEFMLTQFYVGSFLAMLNARSRTRMPKSYQDETIDCNSLAKKAALTSSVWGPSPIEANICLESLPKVSLTDSSSSPRPSAV